MFPTYLKMEMLGKTSKTEEASALFWVLFRILAISATKSKTDTKPSAVLLSAN